MTDDPRRDFQVRFKLCFTDGDRHYVWSTTKTYGGVRRVLNGCGALPKRDGWFIERVKSWRDDEGQCQASCVIIAQSKNVIVHNCYRVIA